MYIVSVISNDRDIGVGNDYSSIWLVRFGCGNFGDFGGES